MIWKMSQLPNEPMSQIALLALAHWHIGSLAH
jgi:hypothetical protein